MCPQPVVRIKPTIQEVKGVWSEDCDNEAPYKQTIPFNNNRPQSQVPRGSFDRGSIAYWLDLSVFYSSQDTYEAWGSETRKHRDKPSCSGRHGFLKEHLRSTTVPQIEIFICVHQVVCYSLTWNGFILKLKACPDNHFV